MVGLGKIGREVARRVKAFDTEIISADSRQFYREMRIGTAVPSEEELKVVKHHFIHSLSIFDTYSVGDFERDAIQLLTGLFEEKDVVLLVGGSGLYVDAVVKGMDDFPKVATEIRETLKSQLDSEGIETLQQELKKVDPEAYRTIDIHNKQRLVRALEIYRETGKPYSGYLQKKNVNRNFNTVYIGLTAERTLIYDRINMRVDRMIEEGLVDEARQLFEHRELNALQTVGYKELFEWMEGSTTLELAIEEIKKNTRRFAKRQGTWYRKNEDIHWFDHLTPAEEILSFLKQKKGL